MSWNAYLISVPAAKTCPHCGGEIPPEQKNEATVGEWNYTHNTSPMIYDALKITGFNLEGSGSWWRHLNGMKGPESNAYLSAIITQLENDPPRYTAMNPSNGWGNFLGLLQKLREMRAAIGESEAVEWSVSG